VSAAQAKALLATVRPRDTVGKARRRVAAELIGDLEWAYRRSKEADKELAVATRAGLMDLHGISPSGVARQLVEVGDMTRSPAGHTSPPGAVPRPSAPPPATGQPRWARSTRSST
jgi:transposase